MKALVESARELPLAHVVVAIGAGAAEDPPGRAGLARLAAESSLRRGAGGRSRTALDEAFDALGGSFSIDIDHDEVTLGGTVMVDRLPRYLDLLGDVLMRPALAPRELEQLRREALAELDELRDDDGRLARRFFDRAVFGAHPYGVPVGGTAESLRAIRLGDVHDWLARWVTQSHLTVGLAGDVTRAQADDAAARLGGLPARSRRAPALPRPARGRGRRIVIVDKPARAQSQILIGHPAVAWRDLPEWLPLDVGLTGFGGTFTSRLMTEVRVKRGWSYGARAWARRARGAGAFMTHVFPAAAQTADTLELVLGLLEDLAAHGLPAREVRFARRYLARSFAFEVETPERRLALRMQAEAAGLGQDYVERFPRLAARVGEDAVARALQRHVRPRDLTAVVTATAKKMVPMLRRLGLPIEVVRYDSF